MIGRWWVVVVDGDPLVFARVVEKVFPNWCFKIGVSKLYLQNSHELAVVWQLNPDERGWVDVVEWSRASHKHRVEEIGKHKSQHMHRI
jgi:hypothetical protein